MSYTILIDGIMRSSRDRKETAHQAAMYLKGRNKDSIVQIRDDQTGELVMVMPDGRIG